ncbi:MULTISPECIES: ATP-binding protein [Ramlibacter]|uniref:histidine kinase n=1 Tax=Ramlibacter pinisoli TaxID=2682844 RepID=A0A6N8IVV3_9BURK|nr:HAMP domain-containing protein [Ramlibacter sp. CGMCC 1.13660]MVQ30918.1 HAMP domain-containing protein [Ramlibacter pinisoli]
MNEELVRTDAPTRLADWLQRRAGALVLAAGYLLFGLLWILFSDSAGQLLFTTPESLTVFQSWKGGGFVLLSALFVYAVLALRRHRSPDEASTLLPPQLQPSGRGRLPVVVLLSLLVLATGLPMVALLGWNVSRDTRLQVDAADRLVRDVARNTASDVASFFNSQQRIAASLAQRDAVRALDPAACDPLLPELAAIHEAVFEISSFHADGRLACGRPERRNLPPPAWTQALQRTRAPLVAPLGREGVADVWRFAVVQPVFGADGALRGAVEMVLPVSALVPLVETPLPDGGAVVLVDPLRQRAGRFPGGLEYVGTRASDPGVVQRMAVDLPDATTTRARGPDGVERLTGVAPVGRTGWYVAAGVPVASIYGPARTAFLHSLLVGLAIVALCVWLVLVIGRSITGPLQGLRRTAAGAAVGDFSVRAPERGPAELAAVAAGFNQMLERLPELQRELRESELRNRNLLEKISSNVPGAIFMFQMLPDGHTRIPFASQGLRAVFELDPADVAHDARPAFERLHPLDRDRVEQLVAGSARSLEPLVAEYRLLLPRAGLRHVLTNALPELAADGSVIFYGSVIDVSSLHQAQQALEEANRTLEQRIGERTAELAQTNQALESFSYSVAHDLRAPLASIDGFAQAMTEALDRDDPWRARGYAARVVANAARMNLLIEGFLALARAGREPLVDSPVDLQRLLSEVLAEVPRPPAARIEVQPLPRVLADQATLRQVWHNLLSNAVKYSGRREQPVVRVACERGDGELVFSVQDNGAGFDPAYAGKLFTPFSRLHKADEFEGTGVGLALVRRIVERHGGRIWARSEPDRGATFSFTLPLERLLAGGASAAPGVAGGS